MAYNDLLTEYLETGILGRMVAHGYALYPAKSAGYEGRRGIDYHVDMSIRTHIINGLFPVTRLLDYLAINGIYTMPENDFRRLLVFFTTHDFHKDPDVQDLKERGEFDVPLAQVEEEMLALEISNFVTTTPVEHRVTMVHSPSPKVGDYSEARAGTSKIEPWVHIADALSSMQTARDYRTVENYLNKILARQLTRQPLSFYWHELDDYRGISTLLLHQAISTELQETWQLFPLLYFPNGVLYIGPTRDEKSLDVDSLRQGIGKAFFNLIQESLADKALAVAEAAIAESQGTTKFRAYAFVFANVEQMVLALRNRAQRKKAKLFLTERIGGALTRKYANTTEVDIQRAVESFCHLYMIPVTAEQDSDFSTKWKAVSSFIMGIESIAMGLMGDRSIDWLFDFFHTPKAIAQTITVNKKILTSGGKADHAIIIAYHYLTQHSFGADRRPADAADLAVILSELQWQTAAALKPFDSIAQRLKYANKETGLETEITSYINEHLLLSFAQVRAVVSPLAQVARERKSGYGKLCSFCNRVASKILKIELAGIVTTTFSNRRIPSQVVKEMQVWCPMCYLEFVLREQLGLGYTRGYSKADSDRLYLFLLPDYSFTPEFWQFARHKLLQPFESVTKLHLRRGYHEEADAPTIPNTWLLHGAVDDRWLDEVQRLFEKAAQEMQVVNEKTGKSPREMLGEKMKLAPLHSPNFQILIYENSVSSRDKKLAPTRSEMWSKAAYSATLLHLLLGVRVYVTDKPYLPLTRPDEMKHIIELDGAHLLLRNVLPRNEQLTAPAGTVIALVDLKEAIDLLSAVWEVNAALSGGKGNRDKQVAGILEQVNMEPLAAARFYKERQTAGFVVYPALLRACELLLNLKGEGKLNLAQQLTEASLQLYIPLSKKEGKAHRYETMLRTAVEVVKTSPRNVDDEFLVARVAGHLLKRLNRIDGGVVPLYGEALAQAATDFARLVVFDLFHQHCQGRAARLTHEENAIADAIYYLTDRQIGGAWKKYKADQAARKSKEKNHATE
ncbi:MAG TPA: type I-D CRISPR-associated protein Cas10d/Csc3 [Anaerolineae bacterium]|nr:type I-D CRISPR-associated protein Cas10d/Csc3 [Pyrinomonadaceae bacterium]HKZ87259.1 type I-D CRISPR-associated protein Cas10d/Csc3 [Anaerolineae bacterium]